MPAVSEDFQMCSYYIVFSKTTVRGGQYLLPQSLSVNELIDFIITKC